MDIKNEDTNINTYKCQTCFRDYTYKSGLQKHNRIKHNTDPTKMWSFICAYSECNFWSQHKSSLMKHLKSKSHKKIEIIRNTES